MALKDNLLSHYELEEASGTRVDAHSTFDLTDNNTVGQAIGKVRNCADFELTDSEHLSHADDSHFRFGDVDFSIACWVNFETLSGTFQGVVSKWHSSGDRREYLISYDIGNSDRIDWSVSTNTINEITVNADQLGAPSTGTWYFVMAWHDSVNDEIGIQVNNGTPDTLAHSTGLTAGDTEDFKIGLTGGAAYIDGLVDEVSLWSRILAADEKTALYNGGNGLAFPWNISGQIIIMGSRMRDFYEDLKLGLIPPQELQRKYREIWI